MKNPIISRILSAVVSVMFCYGLSLMGLLGDDTPNKVDAVLIAFTIPLALGVAVGGGTLVNLFRRGTTIRRFMYIIVGSVAISSLWQLSISAIPAFNVDSGNGPFEGSILFAWTGAVLIQLLFLEWRLPRNEEKKELAVVIAGICSIPATVVLSLLLLIVFYPKPQKNSSSIKETFLIPADYKGEFRVVYNEKGGVEPKMEEGRRIYKIPENGVLVVQPKFKNETIDHEYYLVDNSGKRTEINMIVDFKNRLAEAPGVLFWGPSVLQDTAKISFTQIQPINYTEFTVYRKDSKERTNEEYIDFQAKFNALTTSEVKKTRAKLLGK